MRQIDKDFVRSRRKMGRCTDVARHKDAGRKRAAAVCSLGPGVPVNRG